MSGKQWTQEEIETVHKYYENSTKEEIESLLHGRTYSAIKQRANKYLKLSKKSQNKIRIIDNNTAIMLIQTQDGNVLKTLIDIEDIERILNHHSSWVAMKNGKNNDIYIGDTNSLKLHRFILKAEQGVIVDHINHNTLDNRRINLRLVTPSENAWNRRGPTIKSTTGVRGVQKVKGYEKYRVYIDHKHYGYFYSLEEARIKAEEVYRQKEVID